MGDLIIVGGLKEFSKDRKEIKIIDASKLTKKIKDNIRKIPITFGAHLDEITYIVTNKQSDLLDGEVYRIIPICNPPKLTKLDTRTDKKQYIKEKIKKRKEGSFFVDEVLNPDCKILGFRSGENGKIKFEENIGNGKIYKVKKIIWSIKVGEHRKIKKPIAKLEMKEEKYLLLKVESKNMDIKLGDMVIQNYGDWKNKKINCEKFEDFVIKSKALDDRVGCIAVIYAVRELAKRGILSKAILTSSEEGVPEDVSWGRFVRGTYKEFCMNDAITIVCDGMDGEKLKEFGDRKECLPEAVVVPYTSNGKGGGDVGVFSLLREKVIPELNEIYGERIAVISTDYSSRSYEVKIMDRWALIGFVQWTCGIPLDKKAICHNEEKVRLSQIINMVRILVRLAELFNPRS